MDQKQKISAQIKDKAEAARSYIEKKYSKMKKVEQVRKENMEELEKVMEENNIPDHEKEIIKKGIKHEEAELMRKKRQKLSVRDFESIAIIGRGAFGEVRLCKDRRTEKIVAVKKMKKSEMIYKNQVGHVRAERDILARSDNPWIVNLQHSFQDQKSLYLVMEYLPGGDLMTLLMKKDILSEEESKFYIAEAIMAVDSVHKMKYIHRDLKPDNILIGKDGHIKLSDFGLCKETDIRPKIEFGRKDLTTKPQHDENFLTNLREIRKQDVKRNRQKAFSTVGTPDYIAPEVFGQQGYTETVDWWSIGVILYEMLVGYPPFFSEGPSSTCQKILNWRKTLVIPAEANLSHAATDIIKKLITDQNERLGINGVKEIMIHPFFQGVDWKNLRNQKAAIIPEVTGDLCHKNFDPYEEEEPWMPVFDKSKKNKLQDMNFIGYTYKRETDEERTPIINALQNLEQSKPSTLRTNKSQLNLNSQNNNNNAKNQPLTPNNYLNGNKSSNNLLTDRQPEKQVSVDRFSNQTNNSSKQLFTSKIGVNNNASNILQKNNQNQNTSSNNNMGKFDPKKYMQQFQQQSQNNNNNTNMTNSKNNIAQALGSIANYQQQLQSSKHNSQKENQFKGNITQQNYYQSNLNNSKDLSKSPRQDVYKASQTPNNPLKNNQFMNNYQNQAKNNNANSDKNNLQNYLQQKYNPYSSNNLLKKLGQTAGPKQHDFSNQAPTTSPRFNLQGNNNTNNNQNNNNNNNNHYQNHYLKDNFQSKYGGNNNAQNNNNNSNNSNYSSNNYSGMNKFGQNYNNMNVGSSLAGGYANKMNNSKIGQTTTGGSNKTYRDFIFKK